MSETRTEMVTIRLTTEEHRRATDVAEHFGLNIAAAVRMMFREKAREIGIERPAPQKTRRT